MEIIGLPWLETTSPTIDLRAIFYLFVMYRVGTAVAVIDAVQLSSATAADCDRYDVFYDHGTEYCESCSEICRDADTRGTQEQCRKNCPRYLWAMKCEEKEGWVYDQAEDACRSCCDVCDDSKPDISLQCMRLCPDYFAGTKASSPNSSSHGQGTADGPSSSHPRLPPCARNITENHSHSSAHEDAYVSWIIIVIIIIIIAVILGVVVILFALGVVSITPSKMWRVSYFRRVRPGESEGGFNERGGGDVVIPIEESTAAAAPPCLTVETGDGPVRSMTLRVLTAFADLSVGRNPSRLYQIV